jgi:hypothetical protein
MPPLLVLPEGTDDVPDPRDCVECEREAVTGDTPAVVALAVLGGAGVGLGVAGNGTSHVAPDSVYACASTQNRHSHYSRHLVDANAKRDR